MDSLQVVFPTSEKALLQELGAGSVILNGGTDLLVKRRLGKLPATKLISLQNLKGFDAIEEEPEGFRLLAGVTHSHLLGSHAIAQHFPLLRQAANEVGSVQIRNRGTPVGNVVNASPAGDVVLALVLLDAQLEIHASDGSFRNQTVEDFIVGPGKTSLDVSREWIHSIWLPKPPKRFRSWFKKVGQRKAMAISIASIGMLLAAEEDHEPGKPLVIEEIRLAAGSVAPVVVRFHQLEGQLAGSHCDAATLEKVRTSIAEKISPIGDVRSTARYRRQVTQNLVTEIWDSL
ncbi:MAG TPA: FAD binding domain-containing protein [Thermotogota bacterium]|nr:FAD binding domain-containing protein [Thermotogota bacterium]HRW92807.1 FAD binding domain-containing protein [Thermotogota bacterium]